MQNKPKFKKSQVNESNVIERDYELLDTWWSGKKQSQTNPNKAKFKKAKMNVTSYITKDYENKTPIRAPKKQSQTSKRQKTMQTLLPQRIMKKTAFSVYYKTNPNKPNFRGKKMLPPLMINTRRNPLGYYPDWRFFAVDLGPNLSCFVGLLFAPGPIFSEKKQQVREIPDKAGAGVCRFVYIRKPLYFCQGQGIISADFRLIIEKNK